MAKPEPGGPWDSYAASRWRRPVGLATFYASLALTIGTAFYEDVIGPIASAPVLLVAFVLGVVGYLSLRRRPIVAAGVEDANVSGAALDPLPVGGRLSYLALIRGGAGAALVVAWFGAWYNVPRLLYLGGVFLFVGLVWFASRRGTRLRTEVAAIRSDPVRLRREQRRDVLFLGGLLGSLVAVTVALGLLGLIRS